MRTIPNNSKNTPARKRPTSGVKPNPLPKKSIEKNLLRKYTFEWVDSCRAAGKSPKTLHDYEDKINKFLWWWEDGSGLGRTVGLHPQLVTRKELRAFLTYLREPVENRWGITTNHNNKQRDRLAPASILAYGRVVKAFFNWLEAEEYIDKTPFNRSVSFTPTNREKSREIKRIEQSDLVKVFEHLLRDRKTYHGARDLAIVTFLLETGVRRGELLSISYPDDLDMDKNRCTVSGKTGTRQVPFSEGTRVALKDYLRLRNYQEPKTKNLWLTHQDVPLSYDGINNIFRKIKKETGIAIHAHMFRHTFGSKMAESNINTFTLKELMGHSSISTTQLYVDQSMDKMQEHYNGISPLLSMKEIESQIKRTSGRPRKER